MKTFHILGEEGGIPPIVWVAWRPCGLYVRAGRFRLMLGPIFGDRKLLEIVNTGSYRTRRRSFGVVVPFWVWRLTPRRFRSLELS